MLSRYKLSVQELMLNSLTTSINAVNLRSCVAF